MTEQIYINGVLMESSESKSVSLVFQSPFFTEIDNIVSNRTTSVELPKTTNNLKAIELANLPSGDSLFEYRKHRVVYKRDGIQIFSGWGTLLSITDSVLKFSFVWGNVSAFRTLLDARLRDLQTDSDYVGYYPGAALANAEYYPVEWRSESKWGYGSAQPILPVAKILNRIIERYGVTFNFPNDNNVFNDYYIPLIYRNADSKSRAKQGLTITTTETADVSETTYADSALRIGYAQRRLTGVTINLGLQDDNGVIDVSEVSNICVHVPAGFAYKVPLNYVSSSVSSFAIYAVNEDGKGYQLLEKIPTSLDAGNNEWIRTVKKDATVVVNVELYSFIVLAICTVQWINNPATPDATIITPAAIEVYDNNLENLKWGTGAIFPLYRNLPDWSVSQFIKNLMKIEGLFAAAVGDTEINFATIGELYSNRTRAIDLTMKLSNKGDAPTEKQVSFNNLAQKNWMRWAEDETVQGNFDGYISVKSETLDEENDLVTLDFAPSAATINVWKKNDNGGYEFVEVQPRILHRENGIITFNGLDWETLIRSKYYNYQNAVEYPHTIKASAVLDTIDLLTLDPSVPIYARQWGHYYAITKITTKDNGAADLELLRLGRAKVWAVSTDAEESYDGDTELVVEAVAGGYAVTMKNVSENKIQEYIESNDYHLALFRYGYARRGKTGRKKDRVYGMVGTHTARTKQFRNYRGKLRYRIIGHDALKGRSIKGQTAKSQIYNGASLIFELHDKITLPKMKKARKSKYGRLSNPSARGLGELYVGLIKRYVAGDEDMYKTRSYGWVCVSNMLQVRGYNDTHTQYWEFDKTNIK